LSCGSCHISLFRSKLGVIFFQQYCRRNDCKCLSTNGTNLSTYLTRVENPGSCTCLRTSRTNTEKLCGVVSNYESKSEIDFPGNLIGNGSFGSSLEPLDATDMFYLSSSSRKHVCTHVFHLKKTEKKRRKKKEKKR